VEVGEEGDEFIRRIVERVIADGYAMLTSTTVFGRVVLRMCIINPATTAEDVEGTLSRVAALTEEVRRT
jgi:aromatic-L-amino-acid/L-tryptophan decarboxylase